MTSAHEPRRTRDKVQTAHALRLAMLRVKNKGKKISISSVAAEAGVDPSLVHHVYSDIAEEIRALTGKAARSTRDQKHRELIEARRRNSELKADIDVLLAELTMAASLNLQLEEELLQLRVGADKSAVIPILSEASAGASIVPVRGLKWTREDVQVHASERE